MLADDEEDEEGIGNVGHMSDLLVTEALFWRLVCNLRLSPEDVDKWTLGEMRLADAYMTMKKDYKRIYHPYLKWKEKQEQEDGTFGNL
ncbi:MAG: hypothetical protein IKS96_07275 [Fibrobacter sp.]|nr:hypothetical protein [Fibrobacter sp.]MBR6449729.1 hypothetical protein [Fibrobacter sp.]